MQTRYLWNTYYYMLMAQNSCASWTIEKTIEKRAIEKKKQHEIVQFTRYYWYFSYTMFAYRDEVTILESF